MHTMMHKIDNLYIHIFYPLREILSFSLIKLLNRLSLKEVYP